MSTLEIIQMLFIIVTSDVLLGAAIMNVLDSTTKYHKDKSISILDKYIFLFLFCNIFCYLFLNKIREKRKIDYYKNELFRYEIYSYYGLWLTDKEKEEHIKIKRFLKLKKIKYE